MDFNAPQEEVQATFDSMQPYNSASSTLIPHTNQLNIPRNPRLRPHPDIPRDPTSQCEKDHASALEGRNAEARRTSIQSAAMEQTTEERVDLASTSAISSPSRARHNAIAPNHDSMHASHALDPRVQNACPVKPGPRPHAVTQKPKNSSLANKSTIGKGYNISHAIVAFRYQVWQLCNLTYNSEAPAMSKVVEAYMETINRLLAQSSLPNKVAFIEKCLDQIREIEQRHNHSYVHVATQQATLHKALERLIEIVRGSSQALQDE